MPDTMTHDQGGRGPRGSAIAVAARGLLTILLLAVLHPAGADTAQADERGKQGEIRRLIEVTGAHRALEKLASDMVRGLTPTIRAAFPDTRADVFGLLLKEVERQYVRQSPDFIAALVPVYDRNFSRAEVREMLAFWDSDLGKKLRGLQMQLFQESAQAAQLWAQQVAPGLIEDAADAMRSRGHSL